MGVVLTSEVRDEGAPRAPSFLALLLSVLAHGTLLYLIGGDLLQAPSVVRAADVISLTLQTRSAASPQVKTPSVVEEPEPEVVRTGPSPSPEPVSEPGPRPRPVPERSPRPESVRTESPPQSQPAPRRVAIEPATASAAPIPARDHASRTVLLISPVYAPEPRYPVLARRMGLEGRVLLRVEVTAEGLARSVEVMAGSGHDILDKAALDAVREWRFQVRGLRDGAKMEALEVPIRFALK